MMRLPERNSPAVIAGAVFVAALALFLWLYTRSPLLYDTDAYYHLTVARAQAAEGVGHDFPWIRYGVLGRGYGDKELAFHLLLAPFVSVAEPALGGRLALATFDAAVLAAIAWIAAHAVGIWAALLPFWLWAGSTELAWRMVRLRPELLALLLMLAALWAVVRRRYRLVGVFAALFALSYVAIHAFVGLMGLLFLAFAWRERRWEWRLPAYAILGAGVGLVIHPHFPNNLTVVWFHAVEFFRFKMELDVGTEIQPNTTDVMLIANLGWWLGLVLLASSTEAWGGVGEADRDLGARGATVFGIAALVFGGLYLLMSRFSIYAVPFTTLWLLFEIERRGRRIGSRVHVGGRRALPLWAAAGIALLVAAPVASREMTRYLQRNDPGPEQAQLVDRQQWAAALPEGARVAAPWGSTALYMFYAPQGRYLNVLEPGLLAYADPEIHEAQWGVFTGAAPDVPLRVVSDLESDFLAFASVARRQELAYRLEGDPRVVPLHVGTQNLFRICRSCNSSFVLDWRAAPARPEELNGGAAPAQGDARAYPRLQGVAGGVEGFVDAARLSDEARCATFRREETLAEPQRRLYRLAPYGPATLSVDGEMRLRVQRGAEAVLSRGAEVALDLEDGEHTFAITTCRAAPGGPSGFYLQLL